MEAILKAIKDGQLDAKVQVVISNRSDALALAIARNYGVHAVAIDNKGFTRAEHEKRVLQELEFYDVDFLVLAGYMRVLSPEFLNRFKGKHGYCRVINIHPSLLPDFPGTAGYEDAFAAGVPESGITVHLVDEHIDHGPILAQARFPRLPDDSVETFRARGLALEHLLYPKVLQQIAERGIETLLSEAVSQ
jgi:formyltetrahydrofolate-dependent phosphoribosylglycinamide formyltransferase